MWSGGEPKVRDMDGVGKCLQRSLWSLRANSHMLRLCVCGGGGEIMIVCSPEFYHHPVPSLEERLA